MGMLTSFWSQHARTKDCYARIKDVLPLKLDAGLTHEQISAALKISKGVVAKYVGLATAAGLDWATIQTLDETGLQQKLVGSPHRTRQHVQPDFGRIHQELRRKGMTLMLLAGRTASINPVLMGT